MPKEKKVKHMSTDAFIRSLESDVKKLRVRAMCEENAVKRSKLEEKCKKRSKMLEKVKGLLGIEYRSI